MKAKSARPKRKPRSAHDDAPETIPKMPTGSQWQAEWNSLERALVNLSQAQTRMRELMKREGLIK